MTTIKNTVQTVQPYLFFDGRCEEAIEFYRSELHADAALAGGKVSASGTVALAEVGLSIAHQKAPPLSVSAWPAEPKVSLPGPPVKV